MPNLDMRAWRAAMASFPSGVTIVTAMNGDEPVGTTVSAFTSVSIDPPLLLVCLARESKTLQCLKGSEAITVHVLADNQSDLAYLFSKKEGANRFGETQYEIGPHGAPILKGAAVWFACRIHAKYDGGDHEIVVAETIDFNISPESSALLYHTGKLFSVTRLEALTA